MWQIWDVLIRIPLFILFGSGAGFKQVWTANVGLKKSSYVIFFIFIVFPKLFEDFFTCLCVQKATIGQIIFFYFYVKNPGKFVSGSEKKKNSDPDLLSGISHTWLKFCPTRYKCRDIGAKLNKLKLFLNKKTKEH